MFTSENTQGLLLAEEEETHLLTVLALLFLLAFG